MDRIVNYIYNYTCITNNAFHFYILDVLN